MLKIKNIVMCIGIMSLSACSISVTSNIGSDINDDTIVNYSNHAQKMQTENDKDNDLLKKILDKKSSVVSYTLCQKDKCTYAEILVTENNPQKKDNILVSLNNGKVLIKSFVNDKEYELYNKEVSLMTIDKGSININGEKFSYVIFQN